MAYSTYCALPGFHLIRQEILKQSGHSLIMFTLFSAVEQSFSMEREVVRIPAIGLSDLIPEGSVSDNNVGNTVFTFQNSRIRT